MEVQDQEYQLTPDPVFNDFSNYFKNKYDQFKDTSQYDPFLMMF